MSPDPGSPPPPPGPQSPQNQPGGGFQAPAGGGIPAGQQNAPGAVLALVFGIIGLILCQLFAPFAWWQGKSAEGAIAASPGAYGGKGMATAGKILGIIGTVLMVIGIVVVIIFLIVGAASSSS